MTFSRYDEQLMNKSDCGSWMDRSISLKWPFTFTNDRYDRIKIVQFGKDHPLWLGIVRFWQDRPVATSTFVSISRAVHFKDRSLWRPSTLEIVQFDNHRLKLSSTLETVYFRSSSLRRPYSLRTSQFGNRQL